MSGVDEEHLRAPSIARPNGLICSGIFARAKSSTRILRWTGRAVLWTKLRYVSRESGKRASDSGKHCLEECDYGLRGRIGSIADALSEFVSNGICRPAIYRVIFTTLSPSSITPHWTEPERRPQLTLTIMSKYSAKLQGLLHNLRHLNLTGQISEEEMEFKAEGGFCRVYRSRVRDSGHIVAVRKLRERPQTDPHDLTKVRV